MIKKNYVYNLDYKEFIDKLENESVDLLLTDPPYNMHKAEWDTFDSQEIFMDFTFDWIDRIIPKMKKNGSLYIFNTPFNCAYILPHLVKKGLVFQNWITWDKRDGMGYSKKKYSRGQETILFFSMSKDNIFNPDEIRIPYDSTERIKAAQKKGILKNGKRWYPNPSGKLVGEVWHYSSDRQKNKVNGKVVKSEHITPKPLDMFERIILASSNENDLIVDPFVGSGTTAVAAKLHNRNFIVNDFNAKFTKITNDRLNKISLRLF